MADPKSKNAEYTRVAHEHGYRVEDDGRVRGIRGYRSLKPNDRGYPCFTIHVPGVGKRNVLVHKLMAYQKYGESALAYGVQVRHLDNDPSNNSITNIAIGTPHQNAMDRDATDRQRHACVAALAQRRLSDDQVADLLKDRASGMKYADLCAKYKLAKSTVSYIVNGVTYSRKENSKCSSTAPR